MEIIGFIACVLILIWLSGVIAILGLFGGEEFSSILRDKRHFLWYVPTVCALVYLWQLVIQHSPFTLTIN